MDSLFVNIGWAGKNSSWTKEHKQQRYTTVKVKTREVLRWGDKVMLLCCLVASNNLAITSAISHKQSYRLSDYFAWMEGFMFDQNRQEQNNLSWGILTWHGNSQHNNASSWKKALKIMRPVPFVEQGAMVFAAFTGIPFGAGMFWPGAPAASCFWGRGGSNVPHNSRWSLQTWNVQSRFCGIKRIDRVNVRNGSSSNLR